MRILVLAPHADDEILGCGGLISKYSSDGHEVFIAILTNASIGAPEIFSENGIKVIREAALKAHKLLNVKETIFLDLPAPQLDQYPMFKITDQIKALVKKYTPDIFLIPHKGDVHIDHKVIHDAALVAIRPISRHKIKKILVYETLSETEWGDPAGSDYFKPNYYLDISEHIENKKKAFSFFASQVKLYPHPRSLEGISVLAQYRGMTVNVPFAEAFMMIREVDYDK